MICSIFSKELKLEPAYIFYYLFYYILLCYSIELFVFKCVICASWVSIWNMREFGFEFDEICWFYFSWVDFGGRELVWGIGC